MQTAAIVFGGDADKNGMNASPLMVQNAKNDHTEISSRNCPPFVAHELCRERLVTVFFGLYNVFVTHDSLSSKQVMMQGVNTCDKRRSISEQKNLFPAIDFSLVSMLAVDF